MPDLEKFVKNVMYGGIGAAASLVEKGGDLARSLVEKGQETVRNSQDTADDIKRRLQEFCDGLMKRGEIDISKLTEAPEAPADPEPVNEPEAPKETEPAEADKPELSDDAIPVGGEPHDDAQ